MVVRLIRRIAGCFGPGSSEGMTLIAVRGRSRPRVRWNCLRAYATACEAGAKLPDVPSATLGPPYYIVIRSNLPRPPAVGNCGESGASMRRGEGGGPGVPAVASAVRAARLRAAVRARQSPGAQAAWGNFQNSPAVRAFRVFVALRGRDDPFARGREGEGHFAPESGRPGGSLKGSAASAPSPSPQPLEDTGCDCV
jgi:hypothetical protein